MTHTIEFEVSDEDLAAMQKHGIDPEAVVKGRIDHEVNRDLRKNPRPDLVDKPLHPFASLFQQAIDDELDVSKGITGTIAGRPLVKGSRIGMSASFREPDRVVLEIGIEYPTGREDPFGDKDHQQLVTEDDFDKRLRDVSELFETITRRVRKELARNVTVENIDEVEFRAVPKGSGGVDGGTFSTALKYDSEKRAFVHDPDGRITYDNL